MNKQYLRRLVLTAAAGTALSVVSVGPTVFAGEKAAATAGPAPTAMLGGALPGGAVISARSVMLAPVVGDGGVAAPLAADGSFKLLGLAPGRYRLAVTSTTVSKQTQGATFGEKVNAGLHAAGSALAQGASRTTQGADKDSTAQTSKIKDINGGMPNRISMNVTVAKQTQFAEVDGAPIEVEVGPDGTLSGRATAN